MTIDEVIEHCKRTVEFENKYIMKGRRGGGKVEYSKRYLEHKLVAEWLEELKEYKENKHRSLRCMYEKGYNKGIDETCNYICREWSLDRINTCEDFDKISQQLKVGGIDDN